jgi:hypothetical protein
MYAARACNPRPLTRTKCLIDRGAENRVQEPDGLTGFEHMTSYQAIERRRASSYPRRQASPPWEDQHRRPAPRPPPSTTAPRNATGGVPFLVHALVNELRAMGVEPTAASAAQSVRSGWRRWVGPRCCGSGGFFPHAATRRPSARFASFDAKTPLPPVHSTALARPARALDARPAGLTAGATRAALPPAAPAASARGDRATRSTRARSPARSSSTSTALT